MLLKAIPLKYRKRSGKFRGSETSAPPVALTLVSATYLEAQWVELGFDRAISIAGIALDQISVDDGYIGSVWGGAPAATLINATTVRVPLAEIGTSSSTEQMLNASATTGIVAVDDGGTWAGATGLLLPFPE